jgi:Xaa-Pro dipeptidase
MSTHLPTFPQKEYDARLQRMRNKMEAEKLDACILSMPESICYLTGLNHWGFFALHMLVVPLEGKPYLIARSMEQVTIETQLETRVEFRGYKDSEDASDMAVNILKEKKLATARIGLDMNTMYRSYDATKRIIEGLPGVTWHDSHVFMDTLRFVKSDLEIAAMRQAASITERMMETALRVATAGVNEKAVAAEVYKEMILAGGEPPSFGPFIRPKKRLGEEHGTWGNEFLKADDTLFVELAGSYQRYHAPMGRFVYLTPPVGTEEAQKVCLAAFDAVTDTMRPGATADAVYKSWQSVVNEAGLSDYKRHHAGYMVGMSFPPTWMEGANRSPFGLREGSELVLEAGMTFHVLSWLVGSRIGDYFVSNTVLVTENGGEVLTTTSQNQLSA